MREVSNGKSNEDVHNITEENGNRYSVKNSESMTVDEILDAIKEKIRQSMNVNSQEL